MAKNDYLFYGYEGYRLLRFVYYMFNTNYSSGMQYYGQDRSNHVIYPLDPELLNEYDKFTLDIEEHPELLDTAKKLYIYPTCGISRDAVSKKYKRCLDPLKADVVVLPDNIVSKVDICGCAVAFINDEAEEIYWCSLNKHGLPTNTSYQVYDRVRQAPGGTRLRDLMPISVRPNLNYNEAEAKLTYFGPVADFDKKTMHIFDYLTYAFPREKVVFQDTVMKTLGDETNVPTFENMISIVDMLKSSDESVQELGLKTLAALDFMHYPQAFITILAQCNYYIRGNKALHSSAVKYMLKALNYSLNSWQTYTSKFISRKDYELTKALVKKLNDYDEEMWESNCDYLPFMFKNEDLKAIPRFSD